MFKCQAWTGYALVLLLFSSIETSVAEETDAAAESAAEDDSGGSPQQGGLAEIVVTAQKRSESINKVGLAISALSGDTLKDLNIHSVQDLAQVVPGLTYAASLLDTRCIRFVV